MTSLIITADQTRTRPQKIVLPTYIGGHGPKAGLSLLPQPPLAKNPHWPAIDLALKQSRAQNKIENRMGRRLATKCHTWSFYAAAQLRYLPFIKKVKMVYFIKGTYYNGDTFLPGHVWLEVKIANDWRWYVLDRTIGQFADEQIIASSGGLKSFLAAETINKRFINKKQVRNDKDLLRELAAFDLCMGFFGLRTDYPFKQNLRYIAK